MIFKLPQFRQSTRISCYCSTINEVDTMPIVEEIFKLNKHLYIPRYSYRYKQMYMERVKDLKDYETIRQRKCVVRPQPKYSDNREDAMKTGGLDLIIVNGLAFTRRGKRLGIGGGYYDTYIKNHGRKKTRPKNDVSSLQRHLHFLSALSRLVRNSERGTSRVKSASGLPPGCNGKEIYKRALQQFNKTLRNY
ncbi:hypothetical protein Trydic_g4206 [Trypoxylus dichotomus]